MGTVELLENTIKFPKQIKSKGFEVKKGTKNTSQGNKLFLSHQEYFSQLILVEEAMKKTIAGRFSLEISLWGIILLAS